MQRATQWIVDHTERFSLIIATEHYAQYMGGEEFSRAARRLLVSDFGLVRVNDELAGFREVHEVDGRPVKDGQDRLRTLLESGNVPMAELRRIVAESARCNLGSVVRTFNVPTMALYLLMPKNVVRFKYRKDGEDAMDGHRVWPVRYEETQKPTIIRTSSRKDMPLQGSFWVDVTSGQVLKTHMEMLVDAAMSELGKGGPVRSSASITVTYRQDENLGMPVPDRMLETYEAPSVNRFTNNMEWTTINCSAT